MVGLNLLPLLSGEPWECVKLNARRLAQFAHDHAQCFTHSQGLPYQIFDDGEDSSLLQQGIQPPKK